MAKAIDYLDVFFADLLPVFLDGDLKLDSMISPREVIIFMLTRAPLPVYSPEVAVNRLTYSIGCVGSSSSRKELKEKMRSFEVDRAFAHMNVYGLELLDMNAVILSAPEGSSFLLGAISVSSINPYFSSDMPASYPGIQSFEMWGSVLVLPLTPNKALCIYDSKTYAVDDENGICKLEKKDVDALNSVAL